MRAREFIAEVKNAAITKRQQSGTRGLHLYADGERWNADYVLNRVGMAVAASDGKTMPDIDAKSWIGKNKSAHPYTPEEAAMLKMAYKAVGARYVDVNGGDLNSEEPPGGNDQSPVKAFRGYPR
jgi:hypothetical protein